MGGLKLEITDGIRMFKPKSLKDASSLIQMRDEQLNHQRRAIRPIGKPLIDFQPQPKPKPASPMKKLLWDEMQKRRAHGTVDFIFGISCSSSQSRPNNHNNCPREESPNQTLAS
uniref:Uncharacterized protein n=1 Tax=Salix viminalis TaxID=40686 RepID=A0A6N2K6M2_SALVM